MMCTPDLYYQEFKLQDAELRLWKHKFLKRLDMYHDLMFSEKQLKEPMKVEDFNDRSNAVGDSGSPHQKQD